MNIRGCFVIFLCISSIYTPSLLANEHLPKAPYLDFKCTTSLFAPVLFYDVTASPELAKTNASMTLVVNIGNSQVRLSVMELLERGVGLRVESSHLPQQKPSAGDRVLPGLPSSTLRQFTLRVGNSDVVSWTRYNNGKPTYIIRNFRVYLVSENDFRGHYWITEHFSQEARDNLFAANSFSINAVLQTMPMSLEDQIRLSVSDPIWIMLTTQSGFIYPNRLVFPTLEELLDQRPIKTAQSPQDFMGSTEPLWERPFLLPPVLAIKSGLDQKEVVDKLQTLQREVTIAAIRYFGSDFASERLLCSERLLAYYLEVIDGASPLRGAIERDLEIVKKEEAMSLSGKPVGGSSLNTKTTGSMPVGKQQAIPAEPVEHDASDK